MEKINIAELLKDCPRGMELYSPIFGNVYLYEIRPSFAVIVKTSDEQREEFLYDGRFGINGECMLFPSKENRDWNKFQRPFKDGDVVFFDDSIAIFKEWGDKTLFRTYVTKYLRCDSLIDKDVPLFGKYIRKNTRFATEEEKEKLFKAIKDNGYKWNPETKILEKLPKFKVGYRIQFNPNTPVRTIIQLESDRYRLDNGCYIKFGDEHAYKVLKFNITTLKPFDKVLVRDNCQNYWAANLYSHYMDANEDYHFATMFGYYRQCIPYESNEHLLSTTNDCDDFYKTWE